MTLQEQLHQAKLEWAKLDADASASEKMEKSILATIFNLCREDHKSAKDAEMAARGSSEYRDHVRYLIEARQKSHEAWAKVEYIREQIKEVKRQDMNRFMTVKYGSGEGD